MERWKGGRRPPLPGQESNWNCPRNWNSGRIPGVFDNVVIQDVSTAARPFPVIKTVVEPVNSLFIESNACLSLTSAGSLQIDGDEELVVVGSIFNEGSIIYSGQPSENNYATVISGKDK
ncbi:MAG: hypothetical protein IPM82_32320 [Saprospiraceae bacterium]|nr:hypothetical protein [Saprospiraceae bacterium]